MPSTDSIAAVAAVLGFPAAFFFREEIDPLAREEVSFRAYASARKRELRRAVCAASFATVIEHWITGHFELPDPDLPDLEGTEPELAADLVRAEWGFDDAPIGNLVHTMEAHGVRLFALPHDLGGDEQGVDAFAFWRASTPFVFAALHPSMEHVRFDLAHELAHLVLHRRRNRSSVEAEGEANAFAASFLMPARPVRADATPSPGLADILEEKHTWGVSAVALARRYRKLDLLTEWQYRGLMIDAARRGYRKSEPEPMPRELSAIWHSVFSVMRRDGMSWHRMASDVCLDVDDVRAFFAGLILEAVPAEDIDGPSSPARASLRLVK